MYQPQSQTFKTLFFHPTASSTVWGFWLNSHFQLKFHFSIHILFNLFHESMKSPRTPFIFLLINHPKKSSSLVSQFSTPELTEFQTEKDSTFFTWRLFLLLYKFKNQWFQLQLKVDMISFGSGPKRIESNYKLIYIFLIWIINVNIRHQTWSAYI